MTIDLRERIKEKIEHISPERLVDVLDFLKKIEEEELHSLEVLSFAGTWQDLDPEVLDDLTVDLHKNRMISSREIDIP